MIRRFACALLACGFAAVLPAQSEASLEQLRDRASAEFERQAWPESCAAYRAVVERDPSDGRSWFRLGYALHQTRDYPAALAAHEKAATLGPHHDVASYNAACANALLGETDAAIEWLERSITAGFFRVGSLRQDPDLESLRQDRRFERIVVQMERARHAKRRNVAVFVHEGVELLDFAGPSEVFSNSRTEDGRGFHVYTVAPSKQTIVSQGFLRIEPEYSFEDCPQPDILVLPGGATGNALKDPELIPFVQRAAKDAEVVLSVCTGSLILADARLLDGLEATSHYGAVERLARRAPDAKVRPELRIVDNGKIVTTAGISAGIDGALHVVERLLGRDSAERCAKGMEYEWTRSNYRGEVRRQR